MMLIFWLLIVIAFLWFVVFATRRSDTSQQEIFAIEIMKERFTKGESELGEFEQKRKDLKSEDF